MGPACECADVPDNAYEDGLAADRAVEELNRLQDRPFFLAVGFHKPHLPFNAPKKYWDLYREEDIRPADNPYAPKNAPKDALTDWGEGADLRHPGKRALPAIWRGGYSRLPRLRVRTRRLGTCLTSWTV